MQKEYIVNVHLGGTVQVTVQASDEDQAELIGIQKLTERIKKEPSSSFDIDVIDAEVIQIQEIYTLDDIKQIFKDLKNKRN